MSDRAGTIFHTLSLGAVQPIITVRKVELLVMSQLTSRQAS